MLMALSTQAFEPTDLSPEDHSFVMFGQPFHGAFWDTPDMPEFIFLQSLTFDTQLHHDPHMTHNTLLLYPEQLCSCPQSDSTRKRLGHRVEPSRMK